MRGLPSHIRLGTDFRFRIVVSHLGKCQGKVSKGCFHGGHLGWQKKKNDCKDRDTWAIPSKRHGINALQRPGYIQSTCLRGFPLGRTKEEKAITPTRSRSSKRVQLHKDGDFHPQMIRILAAACVDMEASGSEGYSSHTDDDERPPTRRKKAKADVRVRGARDLAYYERHSGFRGSSYWDILSSFGKLSKAGVTQSDLEEEDGRIQDQLAAHELEQRLKGRGGRKRKSSCESDLEGDEDEDEEEEGENGEDELDGDDFIDNMPIDEEYGEEEEEEEEGSDHEPN